MNYPLVSKSDHGYAQRTTKGGNVVDLKALPYWARIGSAAAVVGAVYFFTSAVLSGIDGAGSSDVLFDMLLAGAFALLAAAIATKAGLRNAVGDRRSGPLDF